MAAHYTKAEVAEIIEQFLDGTGGHWHWDDFTSCRIADPELDAIRVRCGQLYDEPNYPGRYRGPDGLAEMRRKTPAILCVSVVDDLGQSRPA